MRSILNTKLYVQYEDGNKVLHVKVLRVIYGCIEFALLLYNLYVKNLKYLGCSINTYYRCVAKNTIDGNKCTIVCYTDKKSCCM